MRKSLMLAFLVCLVPVIIGATHRTVTLDRIALADSVMPVVVYIQDNGSVIGSGIVYTSDGLIVTCAHVLSDYDGKSFSVMTSAGKSFRIKKVALDTRSDVAVVQINAAGLSPARWGDSGHLRVCQDVMCVGAPFGYYGAVTTGIVTRVHCDAGGTDCVMSDARVNPGNSGGAMFNENGEVVAMNAILLGNSLALSYPSNSVTAEVRILIRSLR